MSHVSNKGIFPGLKLRVIHVLVLVMTLAPEAHWDFLLKICGVLSVGDSWGNACAAEHRHLGHDSDTEKTERLCVSRSIISLLETAEILIVTSWVIEEKCAWERKMYRERYSVKNKLQLRHCMLFNILLISIYCLYCLYCYSKYCLQSWLLYSRNID